MDPEDSTTIELQKVFSLFDRDGNGTLTASELGLALKYLGCDLPDNQVAKLLSEVDKDSSHELDFEEFSHLFQVAELRQTFDTIDMDGNGYIEAKELRGALKSAGYNVTLDQVETMLGKVDKDHDSRVSFDEFREVFKFVPNSSVDVLVQKWFDMSGVDFGTELVPAVPSASSPPIGTFLFAAGFGGCISRTLTAPLERIKLEQQVQGIKAGNILTVFRNVIQNEGIGGFWAGNNAALVRVFPVAGLACVAYTTILPQLNQFSKETPVVNRTISGASAGLLATSCVYPLDVIRTHLALQKSNNSTNYRGILDCGQQLVRNGGVKSLYRGLGVTLAGAAPFLAVQQGIYDTLKYSALGAGFKAGLPLYFGCGMMAGLGAQTVVYPMDMLRRKVQMSGTGVGNLLSTMVRTEGIKGFTSGLSATYIRAMPAVAIAVSCRDAIVGWARNRGHQI